MQEEKEKFFCIFLFCITKRGESSFIFAPIYFIWATFLQFVLQFGAKAVIIIPKRTDRNWRYENEQTKDRIWHGWLARYYWR